MSSAKVAAGVLAGLAAGAILGVLIAPQKGVFLRRMLCEKGEDYFDIFKLRFNDTIDKITTRLDQVNDPNAAYNRQGNEYRAIESPSQP